MDQQYLLSKDNIVLLSVNVRGEYFEKIFSKLEFLTAYSYIHKKIIEIGMPFLSVSFPDTVPDGSIGSLFIQEKIDSILLRDTAKLNFEATFKKDFVALVAALDSYDIFKNQNRDLFDYLKRSKRKVVYITGFMTEFNIVAITLKIFNRGYIPVVVSDGVSSSRERMHFEALEILSNFSYILDSRDLIQEWGS